MTALKFGKQDKIDFFITVLLAWLHRVGESSMYPIKQLKRLKVLLHTCLIGSADSNPTQLGGVTHYALTTGI